MATIRFGLAGLFLLAVVSCTTTGTRQDPKPISEKTAVINLTDSARELRHRKAFEQAAAMLERALRIEPGNPFLWRELALVYLEQGNPGQAIQFAYKSSALTGDESLKRRNSQLVKDARSRLGNTENAGPDL